MIDTVFLSHVDSRFKELMGNKLEFGGIPIVLMGDMYQLPPVEGDPMYKSVLKTPVLEESILQPKQLS